jgi:hypothetical protein
VLDVPGFKRVRLLLLCGRCHRKWGDIFDKNADKMSDGTVQQAGFSLV